jgi:hypothetical protein
MTGDEAAGGHDDHWWCVICQRRMTEPCTRETCPNLWRFVEDE